MATIQVEQEITRDAVYTLPEFMRRTGLKRDAIRTARHQGFQVLRMHGRVFVRGAEGLRYCDERALVASQASASAQ